MNFLLQFLQFCDEIKIEIKRKKIYQTLITNTKTNFKKFYSSSLNKQDFDFLMVYISLS
jgi:hypothetical protein